MIQILGLREFTTKTGEQKLYDAFHENGWRAPDIFDLFLNMEKYVEMIPEDKRWNLFYTVANCTDDKRKFATQDVIPLDIDGIVKGTEDTIVKVVCEELKVSSKDVGVVYSGNGVHILIGLENQIPNASFVNQNKVYFRALCGRINQTLYLNGLSGKADPTVFSEARILRLPYTENRKPKGITHCKLINGAIKKLPVDLFSLADMPHVDQGEYIHPRALARMPDPDREAIEAGCGFIKHCRETQEPITEPEWYAMLSVVGRFKDGHRIAHQYSSPQGRRHPNYSEAGTDEKIRHALDASGPRTCSNISQMFPGCQECPHFKKITSPIQIVGSETIRTQDSGFYDIVIDKNGNPKQGKPNYDDLAKYYNRVNTYITIQEDETVMVYKDTHWEPVPRLVIHKFAEDNFSPTPSNSMCMEFESKLKRTNLVASVTMNESSRLNFLNGVLDIDTGELMPHSEIYKFTYVIPYEYSPNGDCPIFKKFLNDVSCDDQEIVQMLAEYVGYCISGTDPALVQKCALLYGDGANGKSVLINLMRDMVGSQNCSAMSIASINKETYRYQLMGKHFNACAESPKDGFLESETFKAMVAGDEVEVRKLYSEPMMWKCTTKLLFACNELPFNGDFSHGLYRRIVILPFRATFSDEIGNKDPLIHQKMLAERSDIFKYCLDAFAKCRERGYKFIEPRASVEEMEDYKEMGDLVSRFVYGMCKYDSSITVEHITLDTIYNLFALWCKDNNQNIISYGSFARRFGKIINKRYPKVEKFRPRTDGAEGGRGTGYKHLVIAPMTLF